MPALFLRERDVRAVLDRQTAIEAVEEGFRQHGLGNAQSPPWREVSCAGKDAPHGSGPGIIQALAYFSGEKVAVIKHFYHFRQSKSSILRLIDLEAGKTLAIMEAGFESWMRTGAAGAVAAKYLSRPSCQVAGIIGTGNQARAQALFAREVRPIRRLYAYSLDSMEKRKEFAREIEREAGIEVKLVKSAREAVEKADLLLTVTPSTEPIVQGGWIRQGLHITSIGADDPRKVELAPAVLCRADKLVIDYEKALESAQLRLPLEKGLLPPEKIYASIGEVVAGKKPGREREEEITIFQSTGLTAQDVPLALAVYRRARERGIGCELGEVLRMVEEAF